MSTRSLLSNTTYEDLATAGAMTKGRRTTEAQDGEIEREPRWKKENTYDIICFVLIGMSSWWVCNTLASQLPIFTGCRVGKDYSDSDGRKQCAETVLPEGVQFSSYVNITAQLGNIFPLAYRATGKYCGRRRRRLTYVIFSSLLTGLITSIMASMTWKVTTSVAGHEHAVFLLICCFIGGGIGSLHSVVFWQFASPFREECVRGLSIGMACGGLLPMLIAFCQNFGGDSVFNPEFTFVASAAFQCLFILAFWRLRERAKIVIHSQHVATRNNIRPSTDISSDDVLAVEQERNQSSCKIEKFDSFRQSQYFVCIFLLYFSTYALPAFVPIMINGYSFSKTLYTMINCSYAMGDVLGRTTTTFASMQPTWTHLFFATLLCLILFGVQLLAASLHNDDEMKIFPGHTAYLFLALQFVFYFLRGFVVTNLYIRVKRFSDDPGLLSGRLGIAGQAGAALGAFVAFLLISVLHVVSDGNDMT